MSDDVPIVVKLHYDFASTLCYVTHRVMERIVHRFEASPEDSARPPVVFEWSPLDLAALLNWHRGGEVPDDRLENALRVSRELDVAVRMPRTWLDSRRAMATALCLADRDREAAWRERVYTAIFEEGRSCDDPAETDAWARDLSIDLEEEALDRGLAELERRTREAADAMVTGVPTFMLADWPMGGIQDDETMVTLICRFARRARERGTA